MVFKRDAGFTANLVVISLHDELLELNWMSDVGVFLQYVGGQLFHGDVELSVSAESEQAE